MPRAFLPVCFGASGTSIRLPHAAAVANAQRHDAAAERAAGIGRRRASASLPTTPPARRRRRCGRPARRSAARRRAPRSSSSRAACRSRRRARRTSRSGRRTAARAPFQPARRRSRERTGPLAWKVHWMQPVSARRAWITPPALPTNTWPSMTVGCANAVTSPSNPNAHFSFSARHLVDGEPGARRGLKPRVVGAGLQPFHADAGVAAASRVRSLQKARGRRRHRPFACRG